MTPSIMFVTLITPLALATTVWLMMTTPSTATFLPTSILADVHWLAGEGGWTGAGLLGLVLAWLLLRHLPDKDRQMATLNEEWGRRGDAKHTEFAEALRRQADDHHRLITELLAHCRAENERLLCRLTDVADRLDRLADCLERFRQSA